jgi:hypothetical protein
MNVSNPRLCLLVMTLVFTSPQASFAGGLKNKIQQKLEAPRNVQYEPYYLESNYQVQREEKEVASPPVQQGRAVGGGRDAGFQSSTYVGDEEAQFADKRADLTNEKDRKRNIASAIAPASTYTIYSMKYTSELEENVVTVRGEIVFEVFGKGTTQMPLVSNNVGLIDVRVNKGASFVTSQGGKYYLIMNKSGRYNLDFEFLIKASREREHGPGNFSVDVVPAPISQFEFAIPEKDTQIFIEPAIKIETKVEEGKTSAWAVLPNTNSINVRWTKALPKEEIVSTKLDPKLYAETATYSTIGGGVIRSQSNVTYSILQSEVSSLRVALPEDVSVLEVYGADLRDWKVSAKDGMQYLDVFLNFGVKGSYNLSLVFEKNIADGSGVAQMPWIKAVGVERENGYYGIAASTNVELAVKSSDKVTVIDTKQLPSVIWTSSTNPILLAFKYLNPPFDITIEMTRHEEVPVLVAAIDSADHVTLHTKEGKILTKATYQVRNNVKQFLRLDMPKNSKIWSSFVAGKPVKPAVDKEGHILLPLEKSQFHGGDLTQFPVEVVYLNEGKELKTFGSIKMNLPKVDVPINEFYWSVYLPFDYNYFNFDGDVRQIARTNVIRDASGGNFITRGVQGRLKSAVDDIGDQYSPAKTSLSFAQVAQEEMAVKGVLPITINIPQQGQYYRFSKLLVIEGESPGVSMNYTSAFSKLFGLIKLLIVILIVVLIIRVVKRLAKR